MNILTNIIYNLKGKCLHWSTKMNVNIFDKTIDMLSFCATILSVRK